MRSPLFLKASQLAEPSLWIFNLASSRIQLPAYSAIPKSFPAWLYHLFESLTLPPAGPSYLRSQLSWKLPNLAEPSLWIFKLPSCRTQLPGDAVSCSWPIQGWAGTPLHTLGGRFSNRSEENIEKQWKGKDPKFLIFCISSLLYSIF